jgi:hypothetical protein
MFSALSDSQRRKRLSIGHPKKPSNPELAKGQTLIALIQENGFSPVSLFNLAG